jgi:hypothetical protein
MNPKEVSSDEWEDCPQGTLKALAKRSQQQRTQKFAKWAIPSMFVMLLALGGWLPTMFSLNQETLSCDQVTKMLPAYASNTLTATQRIQAERHLNKCQFCAEKLRTIQATLSVSVRSGGWISVHPFANSRSRPVLFYQQGTETLFDFTCFDQPTLPDARYRSRSLFVSVH